MVQGGCLRLLCLLVLALALGQAQRADGAMYFGATIGGETYGDSENAPANQAAWDLFERHAGKKVAILSQGQGWCRFDATRMDATAARGAIPLVTMGLGSGVTLAEVAAGRQDAAIRQWAAAAKGWGRPFLFGPWWEMNGGWYSWGQSGDFVAAWRHFHDVVVQQGATNVTWTWITNSIWSDPASDPSPYYPGNAYVDWAGIDSYNWGLGPAQPDRWRNPDETITPTLSVVNALTNGEKPVVIAEDASSEYGGNKANWIREMLGGYLPHHPEIGAYVWFNWNPERNGIRYDWPIETSAPAQQAFREGIQSSLFVSGPQSPPPLTKVRPPAPAAGDAGRAGDLSPSSELATGPQMALAPDGSATVVWSARDPAEPNGTFAVFARRLDPKGRPLAGVVQLSASGEDALDPHVGVGPDGTATVVWTRSDDQGYFLAQMRRIGPGGVLGTTVDLSQTGQNASSPDVAVASDGSAAVVWKRSDSSHDYLIKERHIAPDGTPEETSRTLSASGQDAVEPDVGIAGDDAATVVWSRFDGEDSIVQGRRIAADGTPAATVLDLSASGQSAVGPRVAVAPGGGATVVWDRFNGSNWIVQAVQLGLGGAPAATLDLSAAGRDAAEPALAADSDGGAVAAWERFDGSAFVVQVRRITAAGAAGQVATLSAAGRDAADPQVAVAGDGTAAVAWSRFDGSDWAVQARSVSTGGALGATSSPSGAGRSAGDPMVIWRPDGALASIWRRFDGRGDVVQEPPPPPWPPEPSPAVAPQPSSLTSAPGGRAATRSGAAGGKVAVSLRIGKPRLDRRRGIARLPVTVSGPGRLLVIGGAKATRELRRAGTTLLRVRARGARRRALQRHGTVRVRLRITFVPAGAEPLSRTVSLRLRKRVPR